MAQSTYRWQPPEQGWCEQDLSDLPEDGNRYWRVEHGDFGPVVYRYELVKGVHYNLLGTVGPDDPVQIDEPWPMRLDPSAWPR
ncbi:hypothetical protein ACWD5Z_30135 [Micromonospora chokoriensis]